MKGSVCHAKNFRLYFAGQLFLTGYVLFQTHDLNSRDSIFIGLE